MRKLSLEELNRLSIDEFRTSHRLPLVVVLDNIRSALNVGSVFRSADAFAIEAMHLCGITAKPPHREITKTAIGASQSVPWHYHEDVLACVRKLKKAGFRIIGVEQTDKSVRLDEFNWKEQGRVAVIFGNEVGGLSDELLPELDAAIEITQFGTKHSLNVAVCAGIVMWEARKAVGSRQ